MDVGRRNPCDILLDEKARFSEIKVQRNVNGGRQVHDGNKQRPAPQQFFAIAWQQQQHQSTGQRQKSYDADDVSVHRVPTHSM